MLNSYITNIANWTGKKSALVLALLLILIWLFSYFLLKNIDIWMLIINTVTTIVTFVMTFIIQYTSNKNTAAIQLKLDELIKVHKKAKNNLIKAEELEEEQILGMAQETRNFRDNI